MRECARCGAPIVGRRRQARYCSTACARRAQGVRYRKRYPEKIAAGLRRLSENPEYDRRSRERQASRPRKPVPPEQQRARLLRRNFGMTIADYDALLAAQGGGCAICRRTPEEVGHTLHVDHCHQTNVVRGILCNGCNSAIAMAQESPATLREAALYVEAHLAAVSA